jgi:2-keto-4-pentenoate hydratase
VRTVEVAAALEEAVRTGVPIPPPTISFPGLDLAAAYEVQQINIRRALSRGDHRVGHKIGLTSRAMQEQLGVDSPDFGVLLASMEVADGSTATVPLLQPRVEAEIAFLLGADLDNPQVTLADVLAATTSVMPALEIIDSRVADWKIGLTDTVADNASSGAFVLGKPVPLPTDLREVEMTLCRGGEEVGRGAGRAVLGHPAECVRWLARVLLGRGEPIRAGSVVLSGALHASVPVTPGDTFVATSHALGSVSVTFGHVRGVR